MFLGLLDPDLEPALDSDPSINKQMMKRAGSASGSVSQRYRSKDPDQDQNVTDPEH